MPTTVSKTSKPSRYIILDTNIFEHLDNIELNPQIASLLKDSISKGYGISMSQYSILELLDTASVENELKAMNTITGLRQFKVNQSVLIAAGHLGCLYKEDGLDNNKQPERGDKVIAATSLINNTILFTTNGRDFPIPFFREISRPVLKYHKPDGREIYIVSYFLEPDIDIIQNKYNSRIGLKNEVEKEIEK
jgi:predicted nucleic acid-binding protein